MEHSVTMQMLYHMGTLPNNLNVSYYTYRFYDAK